MPPKKIKSSQPQHSQPRRSQRDSVIDVDLPPGLKKLTKEERDQLRERNSDKIQALSNRAKKAAATRNKLRGISPKLIKTCISVEPWKRDKAAELAGGLSRAVRDALSLYITYRENDNELPSSDDKEEIEAMKREINELRGELRYLVNKSK